MRLAVKSSIAALLLTGSAAIAAESPWSVVARWPDLQGGVWHADGADGAPHAGDLPLRPEVAAESKQLAARFMQGLDGGSCAPRGMPRHLGNQFVYSTGLIIMLGQADYYQVLRRIHMNRSTHEVIEPAYYGDSIGRWEGGTLVIDTIGFMPDQALTDFVPARGDTHIIERYRLLKPGTMELKLTIENSALFTGPYNVTRIYTLQQGDEVLESYCTNNRDMAGRTDLSLGTP